MHTRGRHIWCSVKRNRLGWVKLSSGLLMSVVALLCVSAPAAHSSHILSKKGNTDIGILHSEPFKPNYPADIYICQDPACVLFFSLNDQNPVSLFWVPLYYVLLFLLFCWVCVHLRSRSHSNTATDSLHREWDSIGCHWQQKRWIMASDRLLV